MQSWMSAQPAIAGELPEEWIGSESELVARARTDRAAFAPLYARYLEPVYRYCYRRLGSQEAAEDATSELFCKAIANLHSYRDGSFQAWLFTIAHNVVVDTVRRPRREEPLSPDYDPLDGGSTPEEMAVAADESCSLHALLARLPADQRSVVELRMAGLTGTEIAVVLGRSLGAVKMLQLRAVNQLRVFLGVRGDTREARDGKI